MTAIAAAFAVDRRDGDAGVRRMLDTAAHRGAQAAVTWSSGPATLGYRASVGRTGVPQAPFATDPGGNAIVFDGRLDNRDDLRGALAMDSLATDAALALTAYAKWSEAAPARMLGDFAFAVWDAARGRLVCARDVFGQRPLFYACGAGATAVASEPQQLLAHPDVRADVNEGAIAEYLSCTAITMEETVWSGVTRLPPAHAVVVSGAGVRRFRYWDFDPDARIEYTRVEEYAEQFRDLFRTAVACRTDGAASVGVFLSGGLDSSGIAGTAQMLARERGAAPVRAYSLTFPGRDLDETPYIDAVVRQWGLPSMRQDARSATREEIERDVARYRDLPAYPNGSVFDPLRRRAAPEVDVVLTGVGGDDWFTGSPLHTADLLREGRLVAAARQYCHDVTLPGRMYTRTGLLRTAIAPLLPRAARAVLRPFVGARRRSYDWIRPEVAARVGLSDRLRWPPARACRSLVQTGLHLLANSLTQVTGYELEDRAAAAAGLEQRHPFNDRRLAEFGFALPESQRWAGAETKVVMRRALEGVLPAAVGRRNDKAEFTSTLVDTLEALGGRPFLSGLSAVDAGWVDGAVLHRLYDEMVGLYRRADESYIPLADALWSVAAVELWFRQRETKERSRDVIET
jgi:asparagine synthase (glutamine-hydrolysing)